MIHIYTEEKLRAHILSRYKSIRVFSLECNIAYSTLDTMFRRGVFSSTLGHVLQVCKALDISVDELARGRIIRSDMEPAPCTDRIDASGIIQVTSKRLECEPVELDGRPLTSGERRLFIDALEGAKALIRERRKSLTKP